MLRKVAAEFVGSLLLSGVVIGSGILALGLASGNAAVALLGNTAATAAILFVLITLLGPVSGAHFNPAVTLVSMLRRETGWVAAVAYLPAQILGCVAGAMLAHAMFEMPLLQAASSDRSGLGKLLAEAIATFTLAFVILGVSRVKSEAVPASVALTIAAGYWWTASTSFANPAITIARALTDSFAGIRAADVPGFIAAQFAGALAAMGAFQVIFGGKETGR